MNQLALLAVFLLAVASPLSMPQTVNDTGRAGQKGDQNHRVTTPNPTATEQFGGQQAARPANSNTHNHNYYPEASDWWDAIVGIATVAIAVFTVFLWWTSRKQWNIANKTLALQFRPKLIVRNFEIPLRLEGGNAKYYFIRNKLVSGQFYVANIGDGPATITESLCIVYWQKGLVLPMRRPYEGNDGNNPVAGKIEPGGRLTAVFQSKELLPISQIEIGMMGYDYSPSWRVYIMGWIEYSDDLGIGRRTAFCRRFDPTTNRFMPVDDPDYEKAE